MRPFLYNDYSYVTEEERNEGESWEVFVITGSNNTFNNNTDRLKFKELNYLDKFYVFEEKGEYLRLCKSINPEEMSGFEDYGWTHKRNLLLSKRCFVTNERGWVNRKALSASFRDTVADTTNNKIYFKKGPGLKYKNIDEALGPSDIYFIFQKLRVYQSRENKYKNWYFLGKKERFSHNNIEKVLCGWISEDYVIEWSNNILVRPNIDPYAIEERRGGGKRIVFFKEQTDMWNFLKYGVIENEIWKENFDLYESNDRNYTKIWFPLISKCNGIIEIGINSENVSMFSSQSTDLVYERGYFVDYIDENRENIFEEALLVSSDEWPVLDESIRKLINIHTKDDLYKIITDYALNLDNYKDKKNWNSLRITDLLCEIYGIVPENSVFGGMVINEIKNISSNKLRKIIEEIEKKYQKLLYIINDNDYEFCFTSHGINYYMIKAELFP